MSAAGWRPRPCPLPTRWTVAVGNGIPHPEHPRPQLVRPTWQNLNGVWECAIRPVSEARPCDFDQRILVPFAVESALSGIGRTVSAAERIWYRRRIDAPEAPFGHTWWLHFGAVDWQAEVWLGDRHLGRHDGGYEPFGFDAGRLGTNQELVVAVWDPTDDGPQPRGKQALHPPRWVRPFFYTPCSGIWQTVWLELVPATHMTRLHLAPHGDTLHLRADVYGRHGDELLSATARRDGALVARATGTVHDEVILTIPDARRWSPSDPFLYDLEIELRRDGAAIDHATSYFGLREIEVRPDPHGIPRLHLNGTPILAHGLLDQGYWPDGIYTAPCDEALRFDLEETRRLGFNLVRKHVKVEPARWYWHCDRIGLLVFQDMPNGDRMTPGIPIGGIGPFDASRWLGRRGIRRTPRSATIFESELTAMIAALSHHPSIVMWVPFNEGWGQYDAARIAEKVRHLDPTRLVDAASGWVDPGNGDVRDVHVYYPGPRLPKHRDATRAAVLGEWGGLGFVVSDHAWPKKPFAYRILPTTAALQRRYATQLDRLQRLLDSGLAAAVWTQTTDVEGEVNGLFTYDRTTLKLDPAWLRDRHQQLFAAFAQATARTAKTR